MKIIQMGSYKCQDGYKLEQSTKHGDQSPGGKAVIMPVSARMHYVRPIPLGLFVEFINCQPTREGMLEFCNQYGPLTAEFCNRYDQLAAERDALRWGTVPLIEITLPAGDAGPILVESMLREQAKFRDAWEAFARGSEAPLTAALAGDEPVRCEILLASARFTNGLTYCLIWPGERTEGADLVFVPRTLREAMWLQFAAFSRTNNEVAHCERCGRPFITGSGTHRRRRAKWCSTRCKSAFHQGKRKEQPQA
jgi:hypothetical protein